MTNQPKIEIPMDKIRDFCRKWKVKEFSLFGPAAQGELNEDGKVDTAGRLG